MKRFALIAFALVAALCLFAGTASAQTVLTCTDNAQSLPGEPGTVHNVVCPPGCGSSTIWGTGTYSDDSSVCTAAIHSGVLTTVGGALTVTIMPGLSSYPATTQNGVTSSQWGTWSRSFIVAPGAVATPQIIECGTNATTLPGEPGAQHLVTCPPGCGSNTAWGTTYYSDDSSVCTAGIHAGVITTSGGTLRVTIQPGQENYAATSANGITTSSWGQWARSFSVATQ